MTVFLVIACWSAGGWTAVEWTAELNAQTSSPGASSSAPPFKSQSPVGGLPPSRLPGVSPSATLPILGSKTVGFRCQIRYGDVATTGYRPMEITVISNATFPADRNLVFRFQGVESEVAPATRNLAVNCPVTVDQGAQSQTFIRYLPQWALTNELTVTVFEDGQALPNYETVIRPTVGMINPMSVGASFHSELVINPLIVIDGDQPAFMSARMIATVRRWSGEAPVHALDDLPEDWRAYQNFDCVVIAQPELEKLSETPDTKSMQALREWLMFGGSLLVVRSKTPKEVLDSLVLTTEADAHFEFATPETLGVFQENLRYAQMILDEEIKLVQGAQLAQGTQLNVFHARARPSVSTRPYQHPPPDEWRFEELYRIKGRSTFADVAKLKADREDLERVIALSADQWKDHLWTYPVGMGRVIGLTDDSSAGGGPVLLPDLIYAEKIMAYQVSPMLRRGTEPMIGNSRFRDWLVPGVAQPPVYTFMGLLTAFVILVGPISYRHTSKHRRGYMMFAIAPLLALGTTVLMFGYGVIADGFGAKGRIRQITYVDARSGDGVERIRSSYFVGIRPGDGIWFPPDAEVMGSPEPRGEAWEEEIGRPSRALGEVTLTERGQHFGSSFLASRRQTQFIVHLPRPGIGRLEVEFPQVGAPLVTNQFGFELRELTFRGQDGTYWSVEKVASGQTESAAAVASKEIPKRLSGSYNDYRPVAISQNNRPGYVEGTRDLLFTIAQGIREGDAPLSGLFEANLQVHLQTKVEIPNGYFLAISSTSQDALVIDEAELSESVRHVWGTYRSSEPRRRVSPSTSPKVIDAMEAP